MIIKSIGYNFKHNKDFSITRPCGLNEYLLLIIRSTAIFKINGQDLHINPNSMILIDKNTPHSFYADSDLYINDWVALDVTDQERFVYFENNIKLNTFFDSPNVSICSEMIRLIQAEEMSASTFKEKNIMNMLQIILNKLQDVSMSCNHNKRYYNELRKQRENIYSHPTEKYTIESLSKQVNLSKSYYQYCYKSYFNLTPIADVINSRIEYSKQLLLSTNFSVSKIAEIIGYQNDIQFIKQFKSVTKTTPNKYRKICTGR